MVSLSHANWISNYYTDLNKQCKNMRNSLPLKQTTPGAEPGFQVTGGGAHVKKLQGGAKIFGVFRVKNHDFKPKNHIFSNFRGRARVHPHLDRPCTHYHKDE
jgi:hypothetical protein